MLEDELPPELCDALPAPASAPVLALRAAALAASNGDFEVDEQPRARSGTTPEQYGSGLGLEADGTLTRLTSTALRTHVSSPAKTRNTSIGLACC